MEYDQAQYISVKKLNDSPILDCGLFINAHTIQQGIMPSTLNKIIPGIKKLVNGELTNIDRGIPNNSPDGEIIKTPPPKIAPIPRRHSKKSRMFRVIMRIDSICRLKMN